MRALRWLGLALVAFVFGIANTVRSEINWRRNGPNARPGLLERLRNDGAI